MNQEQIKSLIRHALTALGILLTMVGLDKFIPVVQFVSENLDTTFAAITTLVGIGTTIWGFFKEKSRWQGQEDQK